MINENELFDHFIIELEGSDNHERHRLSELWTMLFETMDPDQIAIIEEDMRHIVEARANHKKPILSRLTGFTCDMLIMPAYYDELKCELMLPKVVGDILIQHPNEMGFYPCRQCHYVIPRGGNKFPFCPVCGAIIEGALDKESAVPDISK